MEFLKIKKVLTKIYDEETKKQKKEINSINNFIEAGYSWDKYTTKSGQTLNFSEKLTQRQHKKTIKEQKTILLNKVLNKLSTEYLKNLKYVEMLEQLEKANEIEIIANWTNGGAYGWQAKAESRTWTKNNFEFLEGTKTGGCGYDKLSTATAGILNKNKFLFVLIAEKLEKLTQKEIYNYLTRQKSGRLFLGYGFDFYGGKIGSFSGGVGYECHDSILLKLGFKRIASYNGKISNYYKYELIRK